MNDANPAYSRKTIGKKKLAVILLVFVLVAISISAMLSFWHWHRTGGRVSDEERHFQAAIMKALKQTDIVYIKNLTNFKWQQVCYAVPYETKEEVEKKTGVSFPTYYDKVIWNYHDSFWTLLFIDKKSEMVAIRVPRMDVGTYPRLRDGTRVCADYDRAILKAIPEPRCPGCTTRKLLLLEQ